MGAAMEGEGSRIAVSDHARRCALGPAVMAATLGQPDPAPRVTLACPAATCRGMASVNDGQFLRLCPC